MEVEVEEVEVDDDVFTNKRGEVILPEAGDIGLGIGFTNIINFFGNAFNNTVGNTLNLDFYQTNGLTNVIYGKYFLDSETAVRGGINIMVDRDYDEHAVRIDGTNDPDVIGNDTWTQQEEMVTFIAGLEKRRGQKRLQGVYGAEVFFSYSDGRRGNLEYANPITNANMTPTTAIGTGASLTGIYRPAEAYRTTSYKFGNTWGAGLRGFIGVEYFILPKVSLGTELNWGPSFFRTSAASETYEYFNQNTGEVEEFTIENENPGDIARSRGFNVGIGNLGGNINILFYF